MDREALRQALRIGVFLTLTSLALVLAVSRDSPEFVVSVCSLAIGIAFLAVVFVAMRWTNR